MEHSLSPNEREVEMCRILIFLLFFDISYFFYYKNIIFWDIGGNIILYTHNIRKATLSHVKLYEKDTRKANLSDIQVHSYYIYNKNNIFLDIGTNIILN